MSNESCDFVSAEPRSEVDTGASLECWNRVELKMIRHISVTTINMDESSRVGFTFDHTMLASLLEVSPYVNRD